MKTLTVPATYAADRNQSPEGAAVTQAAGFTLTTPPGRCRNSETRGEFFELTGPRVRSLIGGAGRMLTVCAQVAA